MSGDDATLLDLDSHGRRVLRFVAGFDETAFLQDERTQAAVLHELMIIGEAVKRRSREFLDRYPEMPWRLMAGMRDTLIHNYDDVDLEEVWTTARRDVPALLQFLAPLLPKE